MAATLNVVTLYDVSGPIPVMENVDLTQLLDDLRHSIGRFWQRQRRMPAGIIIPLQLARRIEQFEFRALGQDLYIVGTFDEIPVLARNSGIDPLFELL